MKKNLLCAAIAALTPLCVLTVDGATLDTNPPVNYLISGPTLDTVVVTASRQPVPLREVAESVSVLTADDIAASGEAGTADILRSLPGINVSATGGLGKTTSVFIRGEESYRTLVLIDGMNVSDPTAPQVSPRLENILSNGVERIEVLRGPQGMMYGADAGGIINITSLRAHDAFAADATAEYGRYGTGNLFANVRGKSEQADYSLSAAHLETDGFNARSTDTVLRDDDGYINTTLHFNGGIQITDPLRIEATVHSVRASNDYDGFDPSARYVNDSDLLAYRIAATYDVESFLQSLALQRTDSSREDFRNGISGGNNDGTISEAQYKGIWRSSMGDVVYGSDLKQETLKAEGEKELERDQLGYYAEWQGHFENNFYYSLGARHDDNDDFGDHTSYHAGAAYLVNTDSGDVLKLKTTYGTGFRAPSLYEVNYNKTDHFGTPASNVKLKEETSKGFDLGFEYFWKSGGWLEVVYFDQSIYDEIDFDNINFSGYLQDVGASHSRGVETSINYPITRELRAVANYTYNDTEDASDHQRIRRPRNIANIGFDFQPGMGGVTIHANLRAVSDVTDFDFDSNRYVNLDNYTTLEASVNWAVTPKVDLYVRGENLLNDDHQEVFTYNTTKAAVYAGGRFHFR